MHLGQTAAKLAEILMMSEPTTRVVSRLMREAEWVQTGARGRNAPHLTSLELARFLIALMASESPAAAVERLAHFAKLPIDSENGQKVTFEEALSILLDRLAKESWEEARAKDWSVTLDLAWSRATITTDPPESSGVSHEEHTFASYVQARDDDPAINSLPYFGGLERVAEVGLIALFRLAKMVLADDDDPLFEIKRHFEQNSRCEAATSPSRETGQTDLNPRSDAAHSLGRTHNETS